AIRREVLLEAEEQALPPARLRIKAWKQCHRGAHRLPLDGGIHQHATLRVGGKHQRFSRLDQRCTMTSRDSDASLGVERDDRRSVKRGFHMALCATFSYLFPPYRRIAVRSRTIPQP